eukprot:s818_g31.t1
MTWNACGCLRVGQTRFAGEELLPLYTADVLCATAFGKDLGMLETRKTELVQDVKMMLGALSTRSFVQIPYWKIPIIGRYLDGGNAATDRLGHTVKALMNEQAGQGATVVEKLRQMDGDKLSHQEVVGNLIVLFGAGTDTTSVALSWAFYHLARDQQLQQIVADEVKDLPEEVSPQHLDSFLQVHALWLEVLRFNGPAPFEIQETREEVEIDGRVVKPGAEVLLCYRHILKNAPELKAKLGDDLHAFRPSRWLGPEGIVKCPPFDSLPFGHGARVCLGRLLADYEGRLVIAQVVRHFVLEKWQGPPLEEKTSFVVLPAEDGSGTQPGGQSQIPVSRKVQKSASRPWSARSARSAQTRATSATSLSSFSKDDATAPSAPRSDATGSGRERRCPECRADSACLNCASAPERPLLRGQRPSDALLLGRRRRFRPTKCRSRPPVEPQAAVGTF